MTIHIVVSMNSQSIVARTPLQYGPSVDGRRVLPEHLDYRVHRVLIRCIENSGFGLLRSSQLVSGESWVTG